MFGSEGQTAVGIDPRLSLRAAVTERLHLNAALGVAHQPPAFVVPLPGFQPGGLRGGLQRALQESFGIEADLGNATTATATVFQNAYFDMSDPLGATEPRASGCAPGAFPTATLAGDRLTEATNPPLCRDRFTPGTLGPDNSGGGGQASTGGGNGQRVLQAFEVRTMGHAYGLELYLKRALTSKLGGFLSYTLSRSTRSYGNRSYIATFDRTHVLNVALAYDLGRNFRAGTRAMFYTGLPQAPTPDTEGGRLPAFFRLDLRLEKRWQLGERAWLSAVAEWLNATLSKEAISTRCTLAGCEAMTIGPITIPSLGIEGGF
ncbi:MAG: TonB-dependent receptor [Polyangiaceae bacterium]